MYKKMHNQMATRLIVMLVATLVVVSDNNAVKVEASQEEDMHEEGGLHMDFYKHSCPPVYQIVRERVEAIINRDPSQAAGILRIMFHDCFVQGCDASLMLTKPVTEQTALPNNASIRASSVHALDYIKEALEDACPGVVSCADTIALSTAFAVHMVGGPMMEMPTGRRDGLAAASNKTVIDNLPPPTLTISALIQNFQDHSLDIKDLVALSGGHTIGQAHCRVVDLQLTPTVSPDLDPGFATKLSRVCLPTNHEARARETVHLDLRSHNLFDNAYFRNVLTKRATFHTDAALLHDPDTAQIVHDFAHDQDAFFKQFTLSMIKMSHLGVLTGQQGVIRKKCTISNNSTGGIVNKQQ